MDINLTITAGQRSLLVAMLHEKREDLDWKILTVRSVKTNGLAGELATQEKDVAELLHKLNAE